MSSFSLSTDETHSSKQAIFFSFQIDWKNESYLTQWHTEGFQNIKLVSLYSKSVSCQNSICLHFVTVQIKHVVQNKPLFISFQTNCKNEYLTQWHTYGFQNIKLISFYSKSMSRESSKCPHFASVQVKHIVHIGSRHGWSVRRSNNIGYHGLDLQTGATSIT